jgi:hypothetical protein
MQLMTTKLGASTRFNRRHHFELTQVKVLSLLSFVLLPTETKLGTIGKQCRNSMLRAQLIGGAMSVVRQIVKREAKTKKEMWLKALAERRGNKCAAVALANKTVRTAFAMLTQGTEYQAELLTA